MAYRRGVDKFFKTLTKLASNSEFLLSQKTTGQKNKESVKGENTLATVGLHFYSLILNSTRIWRVGEGFIHTPAYMLVG
jgi:hypothetical protein